MRKVFQDQYCEFPTRREKMRKVPPEKITDQRCLFTAPACVTKTF